MEPANRTLDVQEVVIPIGRTVLQGTLSTPLQAVGVVIFAQSSGGGRLDPRNRHVAAVLNDAGLATLLCDLLTEEEGRVDEQTMHLRFDVALLAERLVGATDWLVQHAALRGLPIGYFGASTGAAAALIAAARRPNRIVAIVSRGGRPDMARPVLTRLRAPTLLLVGELDTPVIRMNEEAMAEMVHAEVRLLRVPGARHNFEEPGTLEEAAIRARDWFVRHLPTLPVSIIPAGEAPFGGRIEPGLSGG
jgi:putative phosphoribosyl transferase